MQGLDAQQFDDTRTGFSRVVPAGPGSPTSRSPSVSGGVCPMTIAMLLRQYSACRAEQDGHSSRSRFTSSPE